MNIFAYWSNKVNNEFANLGDCLNPFIFSLFNVNLLFEESANANTKLFPIGSLLREVPQNYSGYIWSTGFLYPDRRINPIHKPFAIRGKYSLMFIDGHNPDNIKLGDGALILDRIYPKLYLTLNNIKYKYKLGIVFHYVDITENNNLIKDYNIFNNPDVVFIDSRINMSNIIENTKEIIDLICSCEYIISSSLHGLIICDSYKIKHASFMTTKTQTVLHTLQQSFKFRDYYSVFNMGFDQPDFLLTETTTKEECIKHCKEVNKPNLEDIKTDLLSTLKEMLNKLN